MYTEPLDAVCKKADARKEVHPLFVIYTIKYNLVTERNSKISCGLY